MKKEINQDKSNIELILVSFSNFNFKYDLYSKKPIVKNIIIETINPYDKDNSKNRLWGCPAKASLMLVYK